jgi:hypothetical protein
MLFFLFVVLIWTSFKSNSIKNQIDVRLYRINVYHKLLFSSVFGVFYLAIFKGGDTHSYWETAKALKNLMLYDFGDFWEVITTEPTRERMYGLFNHYTGYPLRYIYIEEESFFIAIIISFFRLITLDSYFATTFLISFIMANASWKLYQIAKEIGIFNKWLLPLFTLYLPSVAFWASGISKDAVVFIAILYMIYYLSHILKNGMFSVNLKYWLLIFLSGWFVYQARPFILVAMVAPLCLMYGLGLINKIKSFAILRFFIKSLLLAIVFGSFIYAITTVDLSKTLASNDSFSEALIIQQDFENNTKTYGDDDDKRYSLGEIDYESPIGIIKAIPTSIIAGIYRPFIWEALKPSLFFNGIESILLIFLTFWFFMVKPMSRIEAISNNELLLFAFGFVIVIAFMAGFTSIIFGVLVRIRAPLLPFFGLLLSIDWKLYLKKKHAQITNERE